MFLSTFFTVLLLVVIAWFVVCGINYVKRRNIKRAGISAQSPACAKCLYQLGGWSSSTCPECGSDVRVTGVRTGSDAAKSMIAFVIIAIAIFVIAPLTAKACTLAFAVQNQNAHGRFTSDLDPQFWVTFDTTSDWSQFPRSHKHSTLLAITRFDTPAMNGMWKNGRYIGLAPHTEVVLTATHDNADVAFGRAAIEQAVRQVHRDNADNEIVMRHVDSVHKLQARLLGQLRENTFDLSSFCSFKYGALENPGSFGGGGGASTSGFSIALILLIPLAWASITYFLIFRSFKPGWRLPYQNEWKTAAGVPLPSSDPSPSDSQS